MVKQYDVIDAKTMEPVYAGLSRAEVQETIGIKLRQVSEYADTLKIYGGAYYIVSVEQETKNDEFKQEWREITRVLLKNKGLDRIKLVTRENGG